MFAAVPTDFMSKENKLIRKSMERMNEYLASDEKWMNGKLSELIDTLLLSFLKSYVFLF